MASNLEELLKLHTEYKRTVPNKYELTVARLAIAVPERNTGKIADALSDWLKDINLQYYRFRPAKSRTLREDLKPLIAEELETLLSFRERCITTLTAEDRAAVSHVFEMFRDRLGPVGAAKALHVLAPTFLPLWDNSMASAYGISTEHGYFQFMLIRREQVISLPPEFPNALSPLKLLDECDYLRYTSKKALKGSGT